MFAHPTYFQRPYCLLELEAALWPPDEDPSPIVAVVLPGAAPLDLTLLPPKLADTHWPREDELDAVEAMVVRMLSFPPRPEAAAGWPLAIDGTQRQAPVGPLPVPGSIGSGFVGREHDVWRTRFRMTLRLRTGRRAMVALVGSAGVGKSRLLAEYAHRSSSDFAGGIFWIDAARSAAVLEEQLHAALTGDAPEPVEIVK